MQKCYNCGKEVDDNVLICPECGALVRRYTKPAQQIPEPENVPPRSAVYPGGYETPAQESLRERVWLDAAGKPHLNGALCFWLIVCAVFTAYLVVAFGCVLLVYHAQSYFVEVLETFPEFSDMLKLLDVMLESVEAYYAFYVAVPILFAGKLAGLVWFWISKRRIAFYIAAGACALLCIASLLFGGSLRAILYALDMLITFLFLRKDWQKLRS